MHANVRKAFLLTALIGAAAYAMLDPRAEKLVTGGTSTVPTGGAITPVTANEDAGRFALRERAPLGDARGDPFGARAWQPPAVEIAGRPAAPVVPPMPYRFAGKLMQDGRLQVYLSRDDSAIAVKEGDTLDGIYRVESIGETRITLVYLPLKHKESIPVFSLLPQAGLQEQVAPVQVMPHVAQETAGSHPKPGTPHPRAPLLSESAGQKTSRP